MKKVLFLMFLLLLMSLRAAGVKAQVRIGGNASPNAAAVLDLNANDDATPALNKGALALPRVSLASTTATLNGATPITGMLVYNTNVALKVGIYFWDGALWRRVVIDESLMPRQVAWFLIVDTTVTVPATIAGASGNITAPEVLATDLCYPAATGATLVTAHNGWLSFCNTSNTNSPAYTARTLCFRPLIVN